MTWLNICVCVCVSLTEQVRESEGSANKTWVWEKPRTCLCLGVYLQVIFSQVLVFSPILILVKHRRNLWPSWFWVTAFWFQTSIKRARGRRLRDKSQHCSEWQDSTIKRPEASVRVFWTSWQDYNLLLGQCYTGTEKSNIHWHSQIMLCGWLTQMSFCWNRKNDNWSKAWKYQ